MSINIDEWELRTLAKIARLLPVVRGDKPPHPATLYRWATVGIKSASGRIIKLKTVFVGGTRMTSLAWIRDFMAARNDMELKPLPQPAEQEEKLLEEQAAEALRRMRSKGLIDPSSCGAAEATSDRSASPLDVSGTGTKCDSSGCQRTPS